MVEETQHLPVGVIGSDKSWGVQENYLSEQDYKRFEEQKEEEERDLVQEDGESIAEGEAAVDSTGAADLVIGVKVLIPGTMLSEGEQNEL